MKKDTSYTSLRDQLPTAPGGLQAAPAETTGGPSSRAAGFDPIAIRDLVREATALGQYPALLILGKREADSFRHFLLEEFEEEATSPLRGHYYFGMKIVEEDVRSKLELAGHKSSGHPEDEFRPPWRDLDSLSAAPSARQAAA